MEFIGQEDDFVDRSRKRRQGGRPAINKKNKKVIVFDADARRKFLTGFRKRKQERKERYQEKLEKELVEEKGRMREEAKKTVAKKQSSSHSILPEVQHLIDTDESDEDDQEATTSYDIGCTTVSISNLDNKLFTVVQPLIKKEDDDSGQEDMEEGKGFLTYKRSAEPAPVLLTDDVKDALKRKKLKEVLRNPLQAAAKSKTETLVRKEAHRLLQHSDIYKKTLKIKQQRSKKFRLNRLQAPEDTGTGTGGKNKKVKCIKGKIKVKTRGKPAK